MLLKLPRDAGAKLPAERVMMVEGTIDGFPFRAALESQDDGSRALRFSKALQEAVGAETGDTVRLEITRLGEEAELRVPADFREALQATKSSEVEKAQAVWRDITPMARRDWVLWIISAKQEATRVRRIENACDMLASGKRRPCCMPGIGWRTKDADITAKETWLPLANSKGRASAKSTK